MSPLIYSAIVSSVGTLLKNVLTHITMKSLFSLAMHVFRPFCPLPDIMDVMGVTVYAAESVARTH